MNNIKIAKETIKITSERKYNVSGKEIILPNLGYEEAEIYSPEKGNELLLSDISENPNDNLCKISVVNEDSFQTASRLENPLVLNFANAHNAGGGFLLGANAQEEALCRCSTLYASIKSDKAAEMYRYNNTHISAVESDYMILSPNVCIFRNERCELLEQPFAAAVITAPAPNRNGAALLTPKKKISETMIRRIRIILRIAEEHGFKNIVLGAWGCGAFGNNPEDVSNYFKTVIINEKYGLYFDEICFAVYGTTNSKNFVSFKNTFDVYI
ncbi:MAG: TIGR02452 family protein [Clostridia bacterium]|nr:TIGR02452 family protein [Clostridia bacterium]